MTVNKLTLPAKDNAVQSKVNDIVDELVQPDGSTITVNNGVIKAEGVVNQQDSITTLKYWTGTKAQYDAIVTKDSNTLYNVTDDTLNLNNVANIDLSNITDTGYIKMAKASMPSDTYTDLTLGASGNTYTAPADGYYDLRKAGNAGQFGLMGSTLETGASLGSDAILSLFLPVRKGDVMLLRYSLTGTTYVFRFVYAQGSESEVS